MNSNGSDECCQRFFPLPLVRFGRALRGGCEITCGCSRSMHMQPICEMNRHRRQLTDLPGLILFLLSWSGILYFFITAGSFDKASKFPFIDTRSFFIDYKGKICGVSPGVENLPFVAFPFALANDSSSASLSFQLRICVDSCERTETDSRMFIQYVSTNTHGYCFPNVENNYEEYKISIERFFNEFRSLADYKQIIARDILQIALIFPFSFVFALFVCIACVSFCLYVADGGLLSCLGSFLVFISGSSIAFLLYESTQSCSGNSQYGILFDSFTRIMVKTLAYMIFLLTAAIFISFVFLQKKIQMALKILRQSVYALKESLICLVYYSFFILFNFILFFLWIISMSAIVSMYEQKSRFISVQIASNFSDIEYREPISFVNLYILILTLYFFLSVLVLHYIQYLMSCNIVSEWYFSKIDTESNQKVRGNGIYEFPFKVVGNSVWMSLRYHLGTVVLASFTIPIFDFFRYFFKSILSGFVHCFKFKFSICNSCLDGIGSCVDGISKNALVYTAMYGEPFFSANYASNLILWRNIGRIGAFELVSDLFVMFSKCSVLFITTASSAAYLTFATDIELSDPALLITIILILIISTVISSCILCPFEASIDTFLLCFIVDDECNIGKQMFCPEKLANIISNHRSESLLYSRRRNSSRTSKASHTYRL